MADDDVVTRLLARLMSEPGEDVPTGLFLSYLDWASLEAELAS